MLIRRHRIRPPTLIAEGGAEVVMGHRIARPSGQRAGARFRRLPGPACAPENDTEVIVRLGVLGPQADCAPVGDLRILQPTLAAERIAEIEGGLSNIPRSAPGPRRL